MSIGIERLKVTVTVEGEISITDAQGETFRQPVNLTYAKNFTDLDVGWKDSERAFSATPESLDLVGGLTGADGNIINALAEVGVMWVENTSTQDGDILTMNGDANGIAGVAAGPDAATSLFKVPPQGLLLLVAPKDGQGMLIKAGTGDVLKLDPGSKTFNCRLFLAGRSV